MATSRLSARLTLFHFFPVLLFIQFCLFLLLILNLNLKITFQFLLFVLLAIGLGISVYFGRKVHSLRIDVIKVINDNSTPNHSKNYSLSEIFWGLEMFSAQDLRDLICKSWWILSVIILILGFLFQLFLPSINPELNKLWRQDIPVPFLVLSLLMVLVIFFSNYFMRPFNIPPWIRFQHMIQILQRYELSYHLYHIKQFEMSIINPDFTNIEYYRSNIYKQCTKTLQAYCRFAFSPIYPKKILKLVDMLLLLYLRGEIDDYKKELSSLLEISKIKDSNKATTGLLDYYMSFVERHKTKKEMIEILEFELQKSNFNTRLFTRLSKFLSSLKSLIK